MNAVLSRRMTELLYLDEPTLGVDVQSRRALWDHISRPICSGATWPSWPRPAW